MSANFTQTPISNTSGGQEIVSVLTTWTILTGFGIMRQSLLAYILLPEGRGAYAICITFAMLFGMIFTLSTDQGAKYFVSAKQVSVSQGVSLALIMNLVGCGLAIAIAVPLITSELAFFQKADSSAFYLALVLIPLTALKTTVEQQLSGLRRFTRLALFSSLYSIIGVLAIGMLVWYLDLSVSGALMALIVSNSIMIMACLWELRRACGLVWEMPSRSTFRLVVGYGLKCHTEVLGNQFESKIGILVLGLFASAATTVDIGLFVAASIFMLRFTMISNLVGIVLFPRVADKEEGHLDKLLLCLRLICWGIGILLVFLVFVSTPLVKFLLSEAFLPAVPMIWIMAPGIFAYAASGIFRTYFAGVNRPEVCSWAVWLGLSANIILISALYPLLGVIGAAWALTISFILRALFLEVMFHRTTGVTLGETWLPRRSDATALYRSLHSLIRQVADGQWRSVPT